MYRLCFAIPTDDPRVLLVAVRSLVEALLRTNLAWLETNVAPPLYGSGVRYEPDGDVEMQWFPIPVALGARRADCKALAAWRAAELLAAGYPAEPFVTQTREGSTWLHHVRVRTPWGVDDPSAVLGM